MKIIQVTSGYPPSLGGVENVAREISERLAGRNHEVEVFTSDIGCEKGRLKSTGILIPPKNSVMLPKEIADLLDNQKRYESIVRKYKKIDSEQSTHNLARLLVKDYLMLINTKI